MKANLQILRALVESPGTGFDIHARLPHIHLKTVQGNLSALSNAGHVAGERIPGVFARTLIWSITEAGRAELRRHGIGCGRETPSPLGHFGEAIGRVRSVFDLHLVVARSHNPREASHA